MLGFVLGLGLAVAAGFRVFVPLLLVSAAAYTAHLELSDSFAWVGTLPALVIFAVATLRSRRDNSTALTAETP